jgi:hypothetical protein
MYRLFVRHTASGEFLECVGLPRCQTDGEALASMAEHFNEAVVLELWKGARLIATVNAPSRVAEPAFDPAVLNGYFI